MKNLFKLILIALFLVNVSMVQAATLTNAEVNKNVSKIIIEQYKKYTDASMIVEISNLPFSTMEIPSGKITYSVDSNFDKFVARDIKRISIYVNGKLVKNFVATSITKAYKDVLVASTFIERDSTLTTLNVISKKMEVSSNLEYIVTSDMLSREMIARKWFREGEILDKRFVKIKPDVERNAEIQAYFNSNDILIAISAKSLGEGMIGDYVNLENRNYGKKYRGKIIGINRVLIQI